MPVPYFFPVLKLPKPMYLLSTPLLETQPIKKALYWSSSSALVRVQKLLIIRQHIKYVFTLKYFILLIAFHVIHFQRCVAGIILVVLVVNFSPVFMRPFMYISLMCFYLTNCIDVCQICVSVGVFASKFVTSIDHNTDHVRANSLGDWFLHHISAKNTQGTFSVVG